jgi:hypothetical protein
MHAGLRHAGPLRAVARFVAGDEVDLVNDMVAGHTHRPRPEWPGQAATMLSPSTLTWVSGRAWRAGPFCGDPFLMENSLP